MNVLSGKITDMAWNVFWFFDQARPLLERPLWYELGYADNYLNGKDRNEVLTRIDTAIDRSRDAWYTASHGRNDYRRAIELWRQVFGDKFPTYG